jgi:acetyltransferase-like isoleucine patch superfamily enzyme
MKKIIIRIFTKITLLWGSIWYDKKYFVGKNFNRNHLSIGWKWILKYWFPQKILGYGRNIPFPVPRGVIFSNPKNIIYNSDDMSSMQSHGCYFQAINAKIIIGKGTKIAPNVGIITTNHNFEDLEKPGIGKNIIIGDRCWIGMNSVILPGVQLGNHTIVGAGSVVTKSFPDGNCIIAGDPAKFIRKLEIGE